MPILFTCPHCGWQGNVPDERAVQQGTCAGCRMTVKYPGPFGDPGTPPPMPRNRDWAIVPFLILVKLLLVLGGIAAWAAFCFFH